MQSYTHTLFLVSFGKNNWCETHGDDYILDGLSKNQTVEWNLYKRLTIMGIIALIRSWHIYRDILIVSYDQSSFHFGVPLQGFWEILLSSSVSKSGELPRISWMDLPSPNAASMKEFHQGVRPLQ